LVLKKEVVDVVDLCVVAGVADECVGAGVAGATPEVAAVIEAGIVGDIGCTWAMVRGRRAAVVDRTLALPPDS
jgi:hypothetical protein